VCCILHTQAAHATSEHHHVLVLLHMQAALLSIYIGLGGNTCIGQEQLLLQETHSQVRHTEALQVWHYPHPQSRTA
jgi:hypothetical protein